MSDADMTLVFDRGALERLADPPGVVHDARRWSRYVGVVADDPPERLTEYLESIGVDPDFRSSTSGQAGGLAVARQQFPTARHVFVGTTDDDRRFAQSLGWEFRSLEEAAEAAGWTLIGTEGSPTESETPPRDDDGE